MFHQEVRQQLGMPGGVEARVPYYRSGVFLLNMPDLLPPGHARAETASPVTGAIPVAELEALYGLIFLPPSSPSHAPARNSRSVVLVNNRYMVI